MKLPDQEAQYQERVRIWGMIDERTLRSMLGDRFLLDDPQHGRSSKTLYADYAKTIGITSQTFLRYVRGQALPPLKVCQRVLKDCYEWQKDLLRHWDAE
jgi:hypothetical protein